MTILDYEFADGCWVRVYFPDRVEDPHDLGVFTSRPEPRRGELDERARREHRSSCNAKDGEKNEE